MSFPKTLDEWSFSLINELVDKGYYETDAFDFKADLQQPDHQEKSVCAFANANGGFLIFGVRDRQHSNRFIGIERKKDFIKEFHDKIQKIEPTVYFEFKQPPISIPNTERVIHVCYIPQSTEKPHMNRKKLFYIRTQGGSNELMSYNQVRESFYGFEQRKIKIELLGLELIYLKENLKTMKVPDNAMSDMIELFEPKSSFLVELMGQTYPIIQKEWKLISSLLKLRRGIDLLVQRQKRHLKYTSLSSARLRPITYDYNTQVKKSVDIAIPLINGVLETLKKQFGVSFEQNK